MTKSLDAIPVMEMDDMADTCELEYHLGAEFVESIGDSEFGIWMIDHVDGILFAIESLLVSIGWMIGHTCN